MRNLLLFALLFSSFQAFAQKSFSLKDCITYALTNHGSVQFYRNNVDIAKTQTAEAKGLYLPNINLSATAVDNLKLQSTMLPAGIFGPSLLLFEVLVLIPKVPTPLFCLCSVPNDGTAYFSFVV